MFYLNSTLNFGIPLVLVFQLEVCYKVDRLLIGITAQQKGTTVRWYSNKTSLSSDFGPMQKSQQYNSELFDAALQFNVINSMCDMKS